MENIKINNHIKEQIKILLIEDSLSYAKFLQEELKSIEDIDYRVHHVENLFQATLTITHQKYDIVLTDLTLPDADGFEAIERLLQIDQSLPIVVLTSKNDELFSLKAVQMGAQDYLLKGVGDAHLINRSIRYAVERKRVERNMQYLAHHDSLTGLANRLLFREKLEHAVSRAKRKQTLIAILFIDLDRFKQINDTLGHDVGDNLLIEVAGRLKKCVREEDSVARLGGDEFVVVLEDIEQLPDIEIVSKKIINSLSAPCNINGQELYTTPSIGISVYPNDNLKISELLKKADTAMYSAKAKGGNTYHFTTNETNSDLEKRLVLENKLRSAVDNDEFVLYFQPKFDIQSMQTSGAEALLRWDHPEMGMVSPMDFIPLAEETGLIIPIGQWVIEKSCQYLKEWKDLGHKPIRLAVNLSPRQFRSDDIVDFILDTLVKYDIKPEEFEVEITETLLMEDIERTIHHLNKLKAWGLHISIDDFGTGYCSLGYLKKFPLDTLKIDRSFIKDIMTEPDDATITKAIVSLGHALRLNLTAEGIEDAEQLKFLSQLGCEQGQGYFFSKPLPAEALLSFIGINSNQLSSNLDINLPIQKSA